MTYSFARQLAVEVFESDYLSKAIEHTKGNVSQAAREAGLDRVYFHRLMRKHGIKAKASRVNVVTIEKPTLIDVIECNRWNLSAAARELNVSRGTVASLMRQHGIDPKKRGSM
jgi:transcriptional regulator of acetoin/glycerol metabolism